MVVRRVRIESAYPDDIVVRIQEVALETRDQFATDDAYDEYLDETLHALTGTGRFDGSHAYYEVTSIDGLDPVIDRSWEG